MEKNTNRIMTRTGGFRQFRPSRRREKHHALRFRGPFPSPGPGRRLPLPSERPPFPASLSSIQKWFILCLRDLGHKIVHFCILLPRPQGMSASADEALLAGAVSGMGLRSSGQAPPPSRFVYCNFGYINE